VPVGGICCSRSGGLVHDSPTRAQHTKGPGQRRSAVPASASPVTLFGQSGGKLTTEFVRSNNIVCDAPIAIQRFSPGPLSVGARSTLTSTTDLGPAKLVPLRLFPRPPRPAPLAPARDRLPARSVSGKRPRAHHSTQDRPCAAGRDCLGRPHAGWSWSISGRFVKDTTVRSSNVREPIAGHTTCASKIRVRERSPKSVFC
jgi:hypothetical protein